VYSYIFVNIPSGLSVKIFFARDILIFHFFLYTYHINEKKSKNIYLRTYTPNPTSTTY